MKRKRNLKLKMLQRAGKIAEATTPAPAPAKKKAEKKKEAKEEKKSFWRKNKED